MNWGKDQAFQKPQQGNNREPQGDNKEHHHNGGAAAIAAGAAALAIIGNGGHHRYDDDEERSVPSLALSLQRRQRLGMPQVRPQLLTVSLPATCGLQHN